MTHADIIRKADHEDRADFLPLDRLLAQSLSLTAPSHPDPVPVHINVFLVAIARWSISTFCSSSPTSAPTLSEPGRRIPTVTPASPSSSLTLAPRPSPRSRPTRVPAIRCPGFVRRRILLVRSRSLGFWLRIRPIRLPSTSSMIPSSMLTLFLLITIVLVISAVFVFFSPQQPIDHRVRSPSHPARTSSLSRRRRRNRRAC